MASCLRGAQGDIPWEPSTDDDALGDAMGDDVKFSRIFRKDIDRLRDLFGLTREV